MNEGIRRTIRSVDASMPRGRGLRSPGTVSTRWHFGCGLRMIDGWRNTDVEVDLRHRLPFNDGAVVVLGQHVIEHLVLSSEAIPFLAEARRVVRSGGGLWLSTPDMAIICHGGT